MSVELKGIQECSNHLKSGGLVAFPTETVYGLGANAFDEIAVEKIYLAKERPKTDPIIIHISHIDQIHDLVNLSNDEFKVVEKIGSIFWPGPLTLILKASDKIPSIVTANTDFVGIRIPDNKTALNLINTTNLPIAAPSANKFEHISSTLSEHIIEEFRNKHQLKDSIYVLKEDRNVNKINIESTIIKINFIDKIFEILRPGFITYQDFKLRGLEDFKIIYKLEYKTKDEVMDSSGQSIKHYSINSETIMVKTNRKLKREDFPLNKNIGIIDVGDYCKDFNKNLSYYDNLSDDFDVIEICRNYYEKLRKFENFNKIIKIDTLYIIVESETKNILKEKYDSLVDRIYRTCSGNLIDFTNI